MLRFSPDRVYRVSSRWFAGAVFLCSARGMRRQRQFDPSQTDADRGVIFPLPGCTRFVQTAACQLETPSTVPRIGPCGKRTLRQLGLALTTTTLSFTLPSSFPTLPSPFPHSPISLLSSHISSLPFPSFLLDVGPLNPTRSVGSAVNQIWCISAFNYDMCWQQF